MSTVMKEKKKAEKKNKINNIMNAKYGKIIVYTAVLFIFSFLIVFLGEFNTKSLNITTHFSEVSKGQNQDGSPFDIQELLSDKVLEEAASKLDNKIDVKEMKKHLTIAYHTDSEDIEKLKQNIRNGNTEYLSYPVMYRLTYATVSEEIKNEGVFSSIGAFFKQFIMPGKKKVLYAVAESYGEYYEENKIDKGKILNVDWEETDSLDYYNKAIKTGNDARKISRVLQNRYNENPDFISERSKIGFGELYNEISGIVASDIENYKSFIIQNGLTKDKENLLRQFRYMESYNNEKHERLLKRYDIIKDTIEIYDSSVTKVVFIPALDYDNNFYMNRTKVGMDYLVEIGDTAKLGADDSKHNAINFQYLINQFTNPSDASAELYSKADTMYESIKTKINDFSAKVLKVFEEELENETFVRIEVGDAFIGISMISMAIKGLKLFIILISAAYLVTFFIEIVRKKREAAVKK